MGGILWFMSGTKTTVINEGERLTMTLDHSLPTIEVLQKILEIIGGTTPDEYVLSTSGKPLDYSKPLQQQATAFSELTLKKKTKRSFRSPIRLLTTSYYFDKNIR